MILRSILTLGLTSLIVIAKPDGGGALWYDKPAANWTEALPVGNGSLGGMVFGGTDKERIQFNEQTLTVSGNNLTLTGADAATILLTAATDFANSPQHNWRGGKPGPKIDRILAAASGKSFGQLKADHIADHQSLFGRVTANFGPSRDDQPTDQRLISYQKTHDPGLDTLFFQFGRYLMIGSSRPGGLPANLQGIWNQDMKPAWYSGYTTNINVEMNYWLAEPANLSEFSGDKQFLKTRAYPALKELVEYWEDFLVEGPDGKLISPAGWSPEHGPVKKGDKIVLQEGNRDPQPGASYDQQIVWDLFSNYIDASEDLGGFMVDLAWRNGKLAKAVITSEKGGKAYIRANGKIQTITLPPAGTHQVMP